MITLKAVDNPGHFEGTATMPSLLRAGETTQFAFGARFDLFLIRNAWNKKCNFEDLADGFGQGLGTRGDWSAIRDSSPEATLKMTERAINHLGLEAL